MPGGDLARLRKKRIQLIDWYNRIDFSDPPLIMVRSDDVKMNQEHEIKKLIGDTEAKIDDVSSLYNKMTNWVSEANYFKRETGGECREEWNRYCKEMEEKKNNVDILLQNLRKIREIQDISPAMESYHDFDLKTIKK